MLSSAHLIYDEPVIQAVLMKSASSSETSWSCAYDEDSYLQAQSLPGECVFFWIGYDGHLKRLATPPPLLEALALGLRDT